MQQDMGRLNDGYASRLRITKALSVVALSIGAFAVQNCATFNSLSS